MERMATSKTMNSSRLCCNSASASKVQITLGGSCYSLDRNLLARRSATLSPFLNECPQKDLSKFELNVPADEEAFELVARFCHGLGVSMSSKNIIPLICMADYLKMTESHSSDNLLKKAWHFFEHEILPSWDETIRSLHCIDHVVEDAMQLRLIDACSESLTRKALANPDLLGLPSTELTTEANGEGYCNARHECRTNARRRLFIRDSKSEDLTSLPIHIYEPIIDRIIQGGVLEEYVTGSLCQYVKKWVCSNNTDRKSSREIIEAVERLLPCNKDLLPVTLLFELLNIAIDLSASFRCRNGFETRIGKQLDQATVKDLIIPSSVCSSKEIEHDVESLRRIMQSYYTNFTSPDPMGLVKVAKLMEDFLAESAREVDLKKGEFIMLAEISSLASGGAGRCLDGIYSAVDIYLEKHRDLIDSEKEDICGVLEFGKMSHEACDHAAQNQRLPLRTIVQVLFLNQLHLKDVITKEVPQNAEDTKEDDTNLKLGRSHGEESMGKKLLEFEDEKDIMEGHCHCSQKLKKGKASLWQEMKRKFGCVSSIHECDCPLIKRRKKCHL